MTSSTAQPCVSADGIEVCGTDNRHIADAKSASADRASSDSAAVDLQTCCEIALRTLLDRQVARGSLDIFFVGPSEMTSLNEKHMGQSGSTDVLSFPLDPPVAGEASPDTDIPIHLGDLVICPSIARSQAKTHTGSEEAEFALLTIHGVLHILGHDHAEVEEARVMHHHERELLSSLGYVHPIPPSS